MLSVIRCVEFLKHGLSPTGLGNLEIRISLIPLACTALMSHIIDYLGLDCNF